MNETYDFPPAIVLREWIRGTKQFDRELRQARNEKHHYNHGPSHVCLACGADLKYRHPKKGTLIHYGALFAS